MSGMLKNNTQGGLPTGFKPVSVRFKPGFHLETGRITGINLSETPQKPR